MSQISDIISCGLTLIGLVGLSYLGYVVVIKKQNKKSTDMPINIKKNKGVINLHTSNKVSTKDELKNT